MIMRPIVVMMMFLDYYGRTYPDTCSNTKHTRSYRHLTRMNSHVSRVVPSVV